MERLTTEECARLGCLAGRVDYARVRLHRPDPGRLAPAGALAEPRPRGRARQPRIPSRRCDGDLAVLAHELTHCGQYQAWGPVRYYVRGAAAQARDLLHRTLGIGRSPYAYRLEPGKPFESYGMEQQGQIIEDTFRGYPKR